MPTTGFVMLTVAALALAIVLNIVPATHASRWLLRATVAGEVVVIGLTVTLQTMFTSAPYQPILVYFIIVAGSLFRVFRPRKTEGRHA